MISLQCADATILFLDPDIDHAKNLKWLLACFENLSGLKINYDKCELVPINVDEASAKILSQIFCCKIGTFPLKYLGFPLHYLKLRREDLQRIIDKIIKRIVGGEVDCLAMRISWCCYKLALLVFQCTFMSVIKFPKWAIKAITSQMAHFFWGNVGDDHKYHLANWGFVS